MSEQDDGGLDRITVGPETPTDRLQEHLNRSTSDCYDLQSLVGEIKNEAVHNHGVIIVDSWFAEELNGIAFMAITDIGAITDDAIRVKGRDINQIRDDTHGQATYSGWIPKSVIQTTIGVDDVA